MGRQLYTECHICGEPLDMGSRIRLLRQREHKRGKWTETGWALYICTDCSELLSDILETVRRKDGGGSCGAGVRRGNRVPMGDSPTAKKD